MFKADFSFTERVQLNSRFENKSDFKGRFDASQSNFELPQPERIFDSLRSGINIDLSIVETLALMSWDSKQWQTPEAKNVMQHWWRSAVQQAKTQGNGSNQTIMMYRVVLADNQRWPGPPKVIDLMRQSLQTLISQKVWDVQPELLDAVIANDSGKKLANLALNKNQTIKSLVNQLNIGTDLKIIEEAELTVIKIWPSQTKDFRQSRLNFIRKYFKELTDHQTKHVIDYILSEHFISQDKLKLKSKVANFFEIAEWLDIQNKKNSLKSKVTEAQRSLLKFWIQISNYENLKTMVYNLADGTFHSEKLRKSNEAQKNRYDFWKKYQFHFDEVWLLLPEEYLYIKEQYEIENCRKLINFEFPLAVFKIRNIYIFEPFVAKATEAELSIRLAKHESYIEQICNYRIVDFSLIELIQLVAKQDHFIGWQPKLEKLLREKVGI